MTRDDIFTGWAENTDMSRRVRCRRLSFNGRAAVSDGIVVASKFIDLCGSGKVACFSIGGKYHRMSGRFVSPGGFFNLGCNQDEFPDALLKVCPTATIVRLPYWFTDYSQPEIAAADIVSYAGLARCASVIDRQIGLLSELVCGLAGEGRYCKSKALSLVGLVTTRNRLCMELDMLQKEVSGFSPGLYGALAAYDGLFSGGLYSPAVGDAVREAVSARWEFDRCPSEYLTKNSVLHY